MLNQLDVISNINWFDIIEITAQFDSIINDLGTFLKKMIDSGLESLKNSPLGKNNKEIINAHTNKYD